MPTSQNVTVLLIFRLLTKQIGRYKPESIQPVQIPLLQEWQLLHFLADCVWWLMDFHELIIWPLFVEGPTALDQHPPKSLLLSQLFPLRYQKCVPPGKVLCTPWADTNLWAAPFSTQQPEVCPLLLSSWCKATNQGCIFLGLESMKFSPLRYTSLSSALLSAASNCISHPSHSTLLGEKQCALRKCSKQRAQRNPDPPTAMLQLQHQPLVSLTLPPEVA